MRSVRLEKRSFNPRSTFSTSVRSQTGCQIGKLVSYCFGTTVVVEDEQVSLDKDQKLDIKNHSSMFTIANELFLQSFPDKAGSRAFVDMVVDDLMELWHNGSIEPGEHRAVHAFLGDDVGESLSLRIWSARP